MTTYLTTPELRRLPNVSLVVARVGFGAILTPGVDHRFVKLGSEGGSSRWCATSLTGARMKWLRDSDLIEARLVPVEWPEEELPAENGTKIVATVTLNQVEYNDVILFKSSMGWVSAERIESVCLWNPSVIKNWRMV